ncbi:MAG: glutathione S-transferase family protein [Alphaproteobacteria bacterium]
MTMTLYHCSGARSTRVVWTLEEMGLPYDLKVLPFPPRVFEKEYLGVNPLGTVPYFVEGETRMTESAAICQYLVETRGPTPLGVQAGEPDYGAFLNWLYYSDATVTFPQTIVLRYSQLEPEARRLPQAVEDYRRFFLGRLRAVENTLADGRDYLCADRFTIADICVGYALYLARMLRIEDAFTPRIASWWDRLSARPAFRKAVEK